MKIFSILMASLLIMAAHTQANDLFDEMDDEFNGCKKVEAENASLKSYIQKQNSKLKQCAQVVNSQGDASQQVRDLAAQVNLLTVENQSLKREISTLKSTTNYSPIAQPPEIKSVQVATQSESIAGILFEHGKCTKVVSTITCIGYATALEQDSLLLIDNATKITLGNGDTFKAGTLKLANQETKYHTEIELIQGVKTKFTARFKTEKSRSNLVAAVSFRFRADGSYNWVTFRNIAI